MSTQGPRPPRPFVRIQGDLFLECNGGEEASLGPLGIREPDTTLTSPVGVI